MIYVSVCYLVLGFCLITPPDFTGTHLGGCVYQDSPADTTASLEQTNGKFEDPLTMIQSWNLYWCFTPFMDFLVTFRVTTEITLMIPFRSSSAISLRSVNLCWLILSLVSQLYETGQWDTFLTLIRLRAATYGLPQNEMNAKIDSESLIIVTLTDT